MQLLFSRCYLSFKKRQMLRGRGFPINRLILSSNSPSSITSRLVISPSADRLSKALTLHSAIREKKSSSTRARKMLQFCDYFKEAWIIVRTGEARGSVIMRPVVQPPRKTISGSSGFTLAAIAARSCLFGWRLNS